MYTLQLPKLTLQIDFPAGQLHSLMLGDKERLAARLPLFRLGLRDRDGGESTVTARDAATCTEAGSSAHYSSFPAQKGLAVTVSLTDENGDAAWRISVENSDPAVLVEWVDFPLVSLPRLCENAPDGNGGCILHPYNEGVLVTDMVQRGGTDFRNWHPLYPSLGCYPVFPNMVSSQMMAYLFEDGGLYVGAHDEARSVKAIDYYEEEGGVTLQIRLYTGIDFGESYSPDFPIVWAAVGSTWESAAERYRTWLEGHLPPHVRRIKENTALPAWYGDSPLVISYPVRGVHDTDEMSPNALFPYTNALPVVEALRRRTESRLMVLLMHWEGTAPWAPPYVWPPYGDPANFKTFMDTLHRDGDLLGVYCSGFGYTIQSNLVEAYNCREDYEARDLRRGMCAGYDGQVAISKICTAQRQGYDICPASPVGRALLDEAYAPLFESDLDYVQILDQNHGGGQYFCHSGEHGHPQAPGAWMTASMQSLLHDWHTQSAPALLGCESASAEPFIGDLQFSDNRFELNYMIGRPVPLYAYLYHEYVRNFMGNQVCCNLCEGGDTLCYRLAYAFSIGDAMTLVLNPNGGILSNWGTRNFTDLPDEDTVLTLIANLTRFYREEAKPYLHAGRMTAAPRVVCDEIVYHIDTVTGRKALPLPAVLSSAWARPEGGRALVLVNPAKTDAVCRVEEVTVTVPALGAKLVLLG